MLTALLLQDFLYSAGVAVFFILSSIVLAAENSGTRLELSAVVRQPLHPFVVPASLAPPHLPPSSPPQVFGFVVSLFFIADVIFFLRTRGFPFKKDTKEELSNGVAAAQAPPPESEPLRIAADAAE